MKVVVAGGGLVGGVCAILMGQNGHEVELFEYRPDPRTLDAKLSRGKSINLALSTRGRATLARANIEDKILANAIPMKGRMLHTKAGKKPVLYDPNGNECIYSVSRLFLNNVLLSEAEKNPNVKLHFGHKLVSADVSKGELQFRKKDGAHESQVNATADLLVGADGAHSAMRQSMLKQGRTNFSQTFIEHGYMELCIPAKQGNEHAMEKNYLHIWPRNEFMLIALPNQDGSFTVTLFMPFQMFDELMTPVKIRDFFHREFPDAVPLIGEELLISDFLTSKPSSLISIKCSPIHAGKTILIGDAAHAMVPFYGQGMNAGFEDVLILDDLLKTYAVEGIEKCLENFTQHRQKDAEAICDLAMYNYLEMRHLVNQPHFYLRRYIDLILNRIFGQGWMPLYNTVTFSRLPYSKCVSNRAWQDEILAKVKKSLLLTAGVAAISFVYWKGLSPIRIQVTKDLSLSNLQSFISGFSSK